MDNKIGKTIDSKDSFSKDICDLTNSNEENSIYVLQNFCNISETIIIEGKEKVLLDEVNKKCLTIQEGTKSDEVIIVNDKVNKSSVEKEYDVSVASVKNQMEKQNRLPAITINFHDKQTMELYKDKFLRFMKKFLEFEVENDVNFKINVFVNEDKKLEADSVIDEISNMSEDSLSSPSKHRKRVTNRKLFTLDTNPSESDVDLDLRYTSKFQINFDGEQNETLVKQISCFNCGKAHMVKDCTELKKFYKDTSIKQKLQKQPTRYHIEEEQKFKPGKISKELRHALGVYKNDIPPYIYNMRRLGYPPGWLEEAKIVDSDLEMFGTDGKHLKKDPKKKLPSLDHNKIINYPGFNVPLDKGLEDQYHRFGVPPYSEIFSKASMIEFFDKTVKRLADSDLTEQNMEIEEENDDNEDQDKKQHDNENNEYLEKHTFLQTEASLNDLEKEKQKLLEELNETKFEPKFVKTSTFGTPIIKTNSPYNKLPNPDNFSKDVSPVICFENLPNSTGKYEKMTDVLQKVRDTLKKP